MFKRICTALLCMALFAGLLTGCGDTASETDKPTDNQDDEYTLMDDSLDGSREEPFDMINPVEENAEDDQHKADVVEMMLAMMDANETLGTYYYRDKPLHLLTFRAVDCNMTGSDDDRFILYAVAQKTDEADIEEGGYRYSFVATRISGGKSTAILFDGLLNYYQSITLGARDSISCEAVDFNSDGRDEMFTECDMGGSGKYLKLSFYTFDGAELVLHPINRAYPHEDGADLTSFEGVIEDGGYFTVKHIVGRD